MNTVMTFAEALRAEETSGDLTPNEKVEVENIQSHGLYDSLIRELSETGGGDQPGYHAAVMIGFNLCKWMCGLKDQVIVEPEARAEA